MMHDQKQLWNAAHSDGDIGHYSNTPTEFAKEILRVIPPNSQVLELGCGVGNDSVAFANKGHDILATDFSEIAIQKNKDTYKDISGLTFEVLDMSRPFKFNDNTFDVIYARLSLHYFTDTITRNIFQEIKRVLKPNGLICFICKSVKDPLYGKGEEIEKDMFENEGHVRHFFSESYAKSLLEKDFEIKKMDVGDEQFYGRNSAFVKVVATVNK